MLLPPCHTPSEPEGGPSGSQATWVGPVAPKDGYDSGAVARRTTREPRALGSFPPNPTQYRPRTNQYKAITQVVVEALLGDEQ